MKNARFVTDEAGVSLRAGPSIASLLSGRQTCCQTWSSTALSVPSQVSA